LPPALSPGGQPLAGFGDRLGAHLIDIGILTLASMVLSIPLMVFLFVFWMPDFIAAADPYAPEPGPSTIFRDFFLPLILLELALFAVVLVGYYVYHVEMMYKTGQTIGKKVMKIRIVPIDPAATLTRGAAAKRYLVEFVAGSLVPFLSYADGFWQLWDKPYQQTLHDKAAKTVVIKVPS
jgi:uncharacterized RDD family membrane protein YckC